MLFLFFLSGVFGFDAVSEEVIVEVRVIVNAENPVDSLPTGVVAKMFRRQEKRWKNWPGEPRVEPVDQKLSAPLRASFTRRVHGWSLKRLQSFWHRNIFTARGVPPPIRDSDEEVIDFVSGTEEGIGYIRASTALPGTVKELRLVD